MMRKFTGLACLAALSVATLSPAADPAKVTVKTVKEAPPKGVAAPIRALVDDTAVQLMEDGKPFCNIWFRKDVPVKATAQQFERGLRYSYVPESTVLGVMQLSKTWSSFRKQKIKPGLYTMRLAAQPQDGDHMGTAPFNEFLLLLPARLDLKPDLMEAKKMHAMSGKSVPGSTHPAVLLLYPNRKPKDVPEFVDKGDDLWALLSKSQASNKAGKGVLGLGLTMFGASKAE